MMTFVKRWADALWDATAKVVLPDPVLQIENLHAGLEDVEHERLRWEAERRRERRLRATWSITDFVADMAEAFEHEQQEAERRHGQQLRATWSVTEFVADMAEAFEREQQEGQRLRCLAVSGSLRAASANTAVLRVAARLAPAPMGVELYQGLAELPLFNPDLDVDPAPAPVAYLRQELRRSQALIISSPEYAHGVPGSLKNALDWLVSGVELSDMPVALINTSPHATHAQASLAETLRTVGARIVPEACVTLPATARRLTEAELVADGDVSRTLRQALTALAEVVAQEK